MPSPLIETTENALASKQTGLRASSFEALRQTILDDGTGWSARYGEERLSSHFQPIISLSHRRAVGYEGLMRARRVDDGSPRSPIELLAACRDFEAALTLDRLSRMVHLHNFARQAQKPGWLFLNMHPEVFLRAGRSDCIPVFRRMLEHAGVPAERVVIEVLENAVRDDVDFSQSMAYFRSLGCLIALDDFGAGHSNFERVWQIQPEIVKLDRSLIVRSAQSPKVRRMLAQMVSLLHECGALVLMEGIETEDEAQIALESDVDFVQGFYFGRPQPELAATEGVSPAISSLWQEFDRRWQADRSDHQERVGPYSNALGYASVLLAGGRSMEEACASFLALEGAEFCYLLDSRAQQIGCNLWSPHYAPPDGQRFLPLADAEGARWARRPYFRRAMEHCGRVQITRPYLSISSARLSATLSASFRIGGETRVICGDVRLRND